jgi:hypothetical protein
MLNYTVHQKADAKPEGPSDIGTRFVKDGFSWPAFYLTVFWLLWHRIWLAFFCISAAYLLLAILVGAAKLPSGLSVLLLLLLSFWVGLEGNNLWRSALARRGYREIADVAADSIDEASYRFFSHGHQGEHG